MNSEQMRTELEAFVNTGLRQGWRGWPVKAAGRDHRNMGGRLALVPVAMPGLVLLARDRFGLKSDGFSGRFGSLQ